jgi:tetratricopeptide (TPR) repeat protein
LSQALNTKSLLLATRGRYEESQALLQRALAIGEEHELPQASSRARFNLADGLTDRGRVEEGLRLDLEELASSRRMGNRTHEWACMLHLTRDYFLLGRWDDVLEVIAEATDPDRGGATGNWEGFLRSRAIYVLAERGQMGDLEQLLRSMEEAADPNDNQDQLELAKGRARVLRAQGRQAEALEVAELAVKDTSMAAPMALMMEEALEAAFALGKLDKVQALLEQLDGESPSRRIPSIAGQMARFRGKLAAARGGEDTGSFFEGAAEIFRDMHSPFPLGLVLLEHGEWLMSLGRVEEADPLLGEARAIFEGLRATPYLERVAAAGPATAAVS